MTSLLSVHSLSKSFGSKTLFKDISFTCSQGDRIGFLGPNGSGKSTFFKILMGFEHPDSGSISKRKSLRIGYSSQSPEFPAVTVEQVLIDNLPTSTDPLEGQIRARTLLSRAQFEDFEQDASLLSGGWKKRLDIIRAFMQEPDLLLLDEPTNHLDIEGILWLEKFLSKEKISYIVISHDRYFLEAVSNKMMELNRCYPQGLLSAGGPLSAFMEYKQGYLKTQAEQQRSLASQVQDEIEWLRRSPKARTTKSQSRIQRAYQMMSDLSILKERNASSKVSIEFTDSERSTKKLLAAKNIGKSLGGRSLFAGLDITLSPGTRLGIVGKNGTGKTTLLKVLSGAMAQDVGTIKYADGLKLVYFDQHRESLPPNISIKEALSPTTDTVYYRGQEIHVNGWAKKFLFPSDRLNLPVSCISGGERARLLIAKLMLKPADILFLDEPTNDLDIETLEVIEESLAEFTGAVVLISHDRCLMDSLCTQILGLKEKGMAEYFADYSQWEKTLQVDEKVKKEAVSKAPPAPQKTPDKKLTYNEKREWEGMEEAILACEDEIDRLHLEIESNPQQSLEYYQKLADAEKKLEHLFERWQHLQNKMN